MTFVYVVVRPGSGGYGSVAEAAFASEKRAQERIQDRSWNLSDGWVEKIHVEDWDELNSRPGLTTTPEGAEFWAQSMQVE